jgi:hypothetical protein
MALTPNFDRIVATITAADVDKFLRSGAPDDDKQRVLKATTNEAKMRLVGGYMIRTNQITPARLNGTAATPVKRPSAAKSLKTTKRQTDNKVRAPQSEDATQIAG